MKKAALLLIALLMMVFGFTSLAFAQDEEEETTLTVIMEEVPDTDVVRELVPMFEEEHPNLTIEIEALPYSAMRDRILNSFLAPESTFDIVILDNPWMAEFSSAEFLMPLDDYIDQAGEDYMYNDFFEPLRNIGTYEDTVYGIPFYNYALSLIARQDLMEEAGVDAPTSLEEYVDFLEALDTEEVNGVAMQPQRGYKIFEEWKNWLYAAGGQLMDEEGNVTIDSEAAQTALNQYIEVYNNYAPDNSLNWGFDQALRAVASGEAASMISYNWMLPTLNNPDGPAGDLAGNFEMYEVPGGQAVLGAWHWGIPANAANPDASWTFIEWITSPEIAKERVIMGGAPVRESVTNDSEVWEEGFGEGYYTTVLNILEDAKPLATGLSAEEIIEIVGTELNSAVAGEKSVEDALSDAASEVTEAIE